MESQSYKINIINHTRVDGRVCYVVSVENLGTGLNFSFSERYTNLRNLYELMKKESANKNFPSFPPNKLFGYEEEKFVITREKDLNEFFEKINSNENFSKLPSLIKYIEENLKKNPNKEIISSRQIENTLQNKNVNNINKNIFNSSFKGKKLTPEEYKKELIEGKKIVDNYSLKFIKLDYEIEIKNDENNEKKYENIAKENLIINDEENKEVNSVDIGNDDNLKFIGNDEEYLKNVIIKIKNIMEENAKKFEEMSKMVDFDEFLLK